MTKGETSGHAIMFFLIIHLKDHSIFTENIYLYLYPILNGNNSRIRSCDYNVQSSYWYIQVYRTIS